MYLQAKHIGSALREFLAERKNWIPLLALLFILILRLSFICFMGLMPQEAYYFFYSEHPALSYYDHPPGIAYMIRGFTWLFGKEVFVLKLAATVVTIVTVFAFYYLCSCFLDLRHTVRAMALLLSTFMITILSLVSTPDVPLMLWWTLSLVTLYQAVFRGKNIHWVWSGILMGLAFDSKYTALLLPVGVMLFLLLAPAYRRLFFSPWFYICLALFLITISPVIIWNWQHDLASFRFQSSTRINEAKGAHVNVLGFLGTIGHQAAVLIPVLFFSLFAILRRLIKQKRLKPLSIPAPQLFLLCFFVPAFVGFLLLSFFYWVKLNWIMPAYITGIIWVSRYLSERWIRTQLLFSVIIHLGLAVEILFYPLIIKSDDTWVGWNELAQKVKQLKKEYPGYFIFSADDYKTSAVLNFYLEDMVYSKNIIGEHALQFDYVQSNLRLLEGKDALFVDSDTKLQLNGTQSYPLTLNSYFDQVKPLPLIQVREDGRLVRRFLVYLCTNYHPNGKNSLAKGLPANKK